ncbi:MAG TPA: hypothetical protein VGA99_03825, partial [bacterium]
MKNGISIIFAVLGFFIGGLAFTSVGWVTGAVLGFLLGSYIEMRGRIGGLEREVAFLKTFQKPAEPATATTAEPIREPEPTVSDVASLVAERPVPQPTFAVDIEPLTPPPPAPTSTPIVESPILTAIRQYFSGGPPAGRAGNLIVRVGAIVLFFG